MPKPEAIKYLIVHITASPWGNVDSVRRHHMLERDPPFADIGYHYLLTNPFPTFDSFRDNRPVLASDGQVHLGRDLDHDGDVDEERGAHALGYNSRSLGIAYVGEGGRITGLQLRSLLTTCRDLAHRYSVPYANVLGHRETGANKSCPQLDMDHFRSLLHEIS